MHAHIVPVTLHVLPPSSRNKLMETGGDPLDIPELEMAARNYLRGMNRVSYPREKCVLAVIRGVALAVTYVCSSFV